MHDMRKKALKQSGKTVSRKAKARIDSQTGSAVLSPASSPAGSRSGSRYASHQNSRVNSQQGSRYASEDEDGMPSLDYSRLKHMSINDVQSGLDSGSNFDLDSDSDSVRDSEHGSAAASHNTPEERLRANLQLLQDRKRFSAEERIRALEIYLELVQEHYLGSCIADELPTILEQLVKSIRHSGGDPEERLPALEALTATILSCPRADADGILNAVFGTVRAVCKDAQTDDECKVAALQALSVAVLFGGGTRASASELLAFLLAIVASDGQSVEALDSADVVTAALQLWAFVASYMMPVAAAEESGDEADAYADAGAVADDVDSGLLADGQAALEALVDQLESAESDVQASAAEAIGLLFEMARRYEQATGEQLGLREDPAKLAATLRQLTRDARRVRATKSTSSARVARRNLRDTLRSVATSLERGVGPGYSTAGRPESNPHKSGGGGLAGSDSEGGGVTDMVAGLAEWGANADAEAPGEAPGGSAASAAVEAFGYRKRLQVQYQWITIDTWALSVRVDMLRMLLGSGLHKHLTDNPLVADLLRASDLQVLQWDVTKRRRGAMKREKAARKKRSR